MAFISLTSPHFAMPTEASDRMTPCGYGLLVLVRMTKMIMMIIMYRRWKVGGLKLTADFKSQGRRSTTLFYQFFNVK
jgi:hypothetical protein